MLIVMKAFVKKLKKIFKIVKFTKQLVHVKYVIILLYLLINNRVKILIIIQIVHSYLSSAFKCVFEEKLPLPDDTA